MHPFTVSLNKHTSSASAISGSVLGLGDTKVNYIFFLLRHQYVVYSHIGKKITRQWKVLQYNYKKLLRESRVGRSKDQPEGFKIWILEKFWIWKSQNMDLWEFLWKCCIVYIRSKVLFSTGGTSSRSWLIHIFIMLQRKL